jgi:RNA-binding protein 39
MDMNPNPIAEEASTLFLGDLSVFCTEKDIRKLFRPFGPIEAIRVKRGSSNKTNLSYGFIKFSLPESAEQAMKQLNGVMFLGRALR